jgi:ankyrin repeat protein
MLANADVNQTTKEQFGHDRTLLHVAAGTGKLEMVKLLVISYKANVNARDKLGRTPLFLSARNGKEDVVAFLLENGASKEQEDRMGNTACSVATGQTEWKIVKLLGGKVPAMRIPGLGGVTESERKKTKGRRMSLGDLAGFSVRRGGGELGANSTKWDIARYKIYNAMEYWKSATEGKTVMAKLYIEKSKIPVDCLKTSVDGLDRTALHLSCEAGRLDCAKFLVQAGANINIQDRKKRTPLHYAAIENSILVTHMLLESKCEGLVKDILGKTPLDYAIENEHFDIVHLIRQATGATAETEKANVKKKRVLSVWEAARKGDLDSVKMYFNKNDYTVKSVNKEQFGHERTLLHCACATGKLHVVEYLIGQGADTNALDKYKRTPLFLAARNDEYAAIKTLLSNGCDPALADRKGRTAADIAEEMENFRCVTLLNGGKAAPKSPRTVAQSPVGSSPKATPSGVEIKTLESSEDKLEENMEDAVGGEKMEEFEVFD